MANDLILVPDYTFDLTPEYSTLISKFENGVEQRRSRRSRAIRKWKLSYKNRTDTDFNTIKTLFDQKYGAQGSLTWTNPDDSQTYTVRFDSDSLTFRRKAYNIYDFEFSIVEVLS